jgi:hypothetical protein
MFFDIYFSLAHGFEIDFPFLNLWLSTESIAVLTVAVIALRVRKVLRDRKRVSIPLISKTDLANEFGDDFDWSK